MFLEVCLGTSDIASSPCDEPPDVIDVSFSSVFIRIHHVWNLGRASDGGMSVSFCPVDELFEMHRRWW